MKKATAALLAITTLLLCLVSCADNGDEAETAGESETILTAAETETEEEEELKPNLPEGLSFDGHNFVILNNLYGVPGWTQRDIGAEELNGNPINDAVFQRNSSIEEKYSCTIESMQSGDVNGITKTTVTAQDDSIDVVTPFFWNGQLAQNTISGYFVDLKQLSGMDLTSPWYDQKSVKELEIMDRLYCVTTDLTIGDEIATAGVVFNKQLYDDFGYNSTYGDIYEIVREGVWTHELFEKMVLAISDDLDGNGVMDNNDRYGLLYQRDSLPSFINAYDMRIADKDEDGVPYLALINENNADRLDAIFDFIYTKNSCFHVMNYFDATSTDFTTGMCNMFINNQAMFMWIRFADVEMLRTMDVDFGIIPMPKYDEAQNGYKSSVNGHMGVATVIPVSCYDSEQIAMFLEAICCESRKLLTPAYYSVTLQGKISRDEESRDMLDIIFDNRVFDIGYIYNLGGLSDKVYQMTVSYNSDYASMYAKTEKMCGKTLNKFIEKFSELD